MDEFDIYSRAVSRIHAAATRPPEWRTVLGEVAGHLDATAATMIAGVGAARTVIATTIEPEAAAAYVDHYAPLDFVAAAVESGPVGLVCDGWDLVRRRTGTEFYNDWQRRYELTDGLFVRLATPAPASVVISAPPRDQPFATAARVRFLDALVPHLNTALRTQSLLAERERRIRDLGAALDTVGHGVLLLDGAGRLLDMNTAAAAYVAASDGLTCRGETVDATTPPGSLDLATAVDAAAPHRRDPARARVGSQVVCMRASGARPLLLRVVPLHDAADARDAQVAVVVVDLHRRGGPAPAHLLRAVFGLSRAEASVAERLLDGQPPTVIAAGLVVSVATVRTHVRRIFAKTGVHRQADFVRLCSALRDESVRH